ncbi:unnamed protein product [Angiostrongylus costaricensis]|uniref:Uncharacterized protein n=1 Tax=Angiostrongylus costaricensis TaxID=334426 RepID=A0A0R3PR59_ANGCS|nr:unnamed protein product [Angiostrongylus costaricensis]
MDDTEIVDMTRKKAIETSVRKSTFQFWAILSGRRSPTRAAHRRGDGSISQLEYETTRCVKASSFFVMHRNRQSLSRPCPDVCSALKRAHC